MISDVSNIYVMVWFTFKSEQIELDALWLRSIVSLWVVGVKLFLTLNT